MVSNHCFRLHGKSYPTSGTEYVFLPPPLQFLVLFSHGCTSSEQNIPSTASRIRSSQHITSGISSIRQTIATLHSAAPPANRTYPPQPPVYRVAHSRLHRNKTPFLSQASLIVITHSAFRANHRLEGSDARSASHVDRILSLPMLFNTARLRLKEAKATKAWIRNHVLVSVMCSLTSHTDIH